MATKEKTTETAIKDAKLASAKRLCGMLASAQRNGTLRPVNSNAKPILMEMRVKSA